MLAFVVLASAALFIGADGSIGTIWNLANSVLVNGRNAASGATP